MIEFFSQDTAPSAAPTSAATTRQVFADQINQPPPLGRDQLALHVFASCYPDQTKIVDSFTDYGSPFHDSPLGDVVFEAYDAQNQIVFKQNTEWSSVNGSRYGSTSLHRAISAEDALRIHEIRITCHGHSDVRVAKSAQNYSVQATAVDSDSVRITYNADEYGNLTVWPDATKVYNGQAVPYVPNGHSVSGLVYLDTPDVFVDFTHGIKTVKRRVKVHVLGR